MVDIAPQKTIALKQRAASQQKAALQQKAAPEPQFVPHQQTAPIPEDYYRRNFLFLLNQVRGLYDDLLQPDELDFIHKFSCLDNRAQCLYVRLLTRVGPYYLVDKLNYTEVGDTPQASQILAQSGLVCINPELDTVNYLNLLTTTQLKQLAKALELVTKSSYKKAQLVNLLTEQDASLLLKICRQQHPLIFLNSQPLAQFMVFLFFGNHHQDLSEFVLQDIGLVAYEKYPLNSEHRLYQNRNDLEQHWQTCELSLWYELLYQQGQLTQAYQDDIINKLNEFDSQHKKVQRRKSKLLNRIAHHLEQGKQASKALTLYQHNSDSFAVERRIRILVKQQDYQNALYQLTPLSQQHDPALREFCDFFMHKHRQDFAQLTLSKSQEKHLEQASNEYLALKNIEQDFSVHNLLLEKLALPVEQITAQHYGENCFYVENNLFKGLLGLLIWDIVFSAVDGAFLNSFQRGPLDLFSKDFYRQRKHSIDQRLALLAHSEPFHWQHIMLKHYGAKQGLANFLVNWKVLSPRIVALALETISGKQLAAIFKRLLQDLALFGSGFPDLVLFNIKHQQFTLIEVKGPGDSLQKNQKRWLRFFAKHQIPCQVAKVSWQQ